MVFSLCKQFLIGSMYDLQLGSSACNMVSAIGAISFQLLPQERERIPQQCCCIACKPIPCEICYYLGTDTLATLKLNEGDVVLCKLSGPIAFSIAQCGAKITGYQPCVIRHGLMCMLKVIFWR